MLDSVRDRRRICCNRQQRLGIRPHHLDSLKAEDERDRVRPVAEAADEDLGDAAETGSDGGESDGPLSDPGKDGARGSQ
jgi:hypothetical protein